MSTKRRLLLDDEQSTEEQKATETIGGMELPQGQRSKLRSCQEHVVTEFCGIRYQKCGGGRRVIRKSLEGN